MFEFHFFKTYHSLQKRLVYLLFILAIFFLLWNFDQDPSNLKSLSDFFDEGFWTQNAISKVRYGNYFTDSNSQAYFGAAIYNQFLRLSFSLFGVSFFSARLVSLFFLGLTTLVVYTIIKSKVSSQTNSLLFTAGFLMLYDQKIFYNWATPVPTEMFFQSLVILFLVKHKLDRFRNQLFGILLIYLAYLSKSTSIWLIGLFLFFSLFDIYKENLKNNSLKNIFRATKILALVRVLCLAFAPYFIIAFVFQSLEAERYTSFKELIRFNVDINFFFFKEFFNPVYYLEQLFNTFRLPSTAILFTVILYFFIRALYKRISWIRFFKKEENRIFLVLLAFILINFWFLLFVGQVGIERRQIHLMIPLYLLFVFLLQVYSAQLESFKSRLLFFCLFLFVLLDQGISAYALFNFHHFHTQGLFPSFFSMHRYNQIGLVAFYAGFILILMYLLYRRKTNSLFFLFLSVNLVLHIFFHHSANTVDVACAKISKIAQKHQIRSVVGFHAHELAIGTNLIPRWWMDPSINLPNWNLDSTLFLSKTPVLLLTDETQLAKEGYFSRLNIPKQSKIIENGSIFLYSNKFVGGYADSLSYYVICKE